MDISSDAIRDRYKEAYDCLTLPYRVHIKQLEDELARELGAHREREAVRLAPFKDQVARLQSEESAVAALLDDLQQVYDQARTQEDTRLAPLRVQLTRHEVAFAEACRNYACSLASYERLSEAAARARSDVVAAAGALCPLASLPPGVAAKLTDLESARDVERGLLLRLLRHSHEGYTVAWSSWQYPAMERAVLMAQGALQSEQNRPGAPPLLAMHRELESSKRRLLSLRVALVSARKVLRDQTEAGAGEWDIVAVRLNGGINAATAEFEEAIPELRVRAEQTAAAFVFLSG